jgi:hypothetical protein
VRQCASSSNDVCRDTTKGGNADLMPIATELLPYLEDAIAVNVGRPAAYAQATTPLAVKPRAVETGSAEDAEFLGDRLLVLGR